MSRLPTIFLLAAEKSAITHWKENGKSSRVRKIDNNTSMIDVNKNKHVELSTDEKLTNQHLFKLSVNVM